MGAACSRCAIPPQSDIIWCFPALPQNTAETFAQHAIDRNSRLVVLGSTSAFPGGLPDVVDERVPVNLSIPRVSSEEHLRTTFGATVLRLSGLYGPGRHVFDWIRRGKIKNSNKYVNLIHVEDVAELCLLALRYALPGSTYIVSDGHPRRWAEICRFAAERFQIAVPPATTARDTGIFGLFVTTDHGETTLPSEYPVRFQVPTEISGPVHGAR